MDRGVQPRDPLQVSGRQVRSASRVRSRVGTPQGRRDPCRCYGLSPDGTACGDRDTHRIHPRLRSIGTGLVRTFARPTANLTGLTHLNASLNPKRLEILRQALPKEVDITGVWQRGGLGEHTERVMLAETKAAAATLGFRLQLLEVRSAGELDAVFAAAVRGRPGALFVLPGPVFRSNARRVVELVARAGLPAVYFGREFPEVGGLMSYGADLVDTMRAAASYVDRLLKGARPADLPVEQGSKFELVINVKTAKALGLTIPPSLLVRADQVIE